MANIEERARDFCFATTLSAGADLDHVTVHKLMADFATSEIEPYRTALAELVEALDKYDPKVMLTTTFEMDDALAAAKKLLEADND